MGLYVVSVLPSFKHKGVATQLLTAFTQYVLSKGKNAVSVTSYEPEGLLYLKPLIAREKLKNNLNWIERE